MNITRIFNLKLLLSFLLYVSFWNYYLNRSLLAAPENRNSQEYTSQQYETSQSLILGRWQMNADRDRQLLNNSYINSSSEEEVLEKILEIAPPVFLEFSEDKTLSLSSENKVWNYEINGSTLRMFDGELEEEPLIFFVSETELILYNQEEIITFRRFSKILEAEVISNIAGIARAQQAYHFEMNQFSNNLVDLGLKIPQENEYYRYQLNTSGNAVFFSAIAKLPELYSFTGGVSFIGGSTNTILCRSNTVGFQNLEYPALRNGILVCADGSINIEKIRENKRQNPLFNEDRKEELLSLYSEANLLSLEGEAKNLLGAIDRAQKFFYIERNRFSDSIADLGLQIPEESESYRYYHYLDNVDNIVFYSAVTKSPSLASFIGATYLNQTNNYMNSIICASNTKGSTSLNRPYRQGLEMFCARGTIKVE